MPEEPMTDERRQSLSTKAARNLATTTKTPPQMIGITPRWLLKLLPWVDVEAGTYRVNRRKILIGEDERILVDMQEGQARVEGKHLKALSLFRGVDETLIESTASRFVSEQYEVGQTIMREGDPGDKFYIIAHGKVEVWTTGAYGQKIQLRIMASGDYFGEMALLHDSPRIATVDALTPCILLALNRTDFDVLVNETPALRDALERTVQERVTAKAALVEESGEKKIEIASSHEGEVDLPATFVDYADEPREYSLSVVQTILGVHTRVSDLYNDPINQLREQLRLTIEGMKERQEWEIINNKDFGLIHAAAPSMRVQTRKGPPTPDDMDELLSRVWKKPAFFLAHPKAIAAFGRECTARGVPPPTVDMFGVPFLTWRGVPIVPSDKLLVNGKSRPDRAAGTTHILLIRVGEEEQGVVGLHQTGLLEEQLPSLSVRFMGINSKAIANYLLTLYFSVAVLADDALGVLENVEVGNYYEYKAIPLAK